MSYIIILKSIAKRKKPKQNSSKKLPLSFLLRIGYSMKWVMCSGIPRELVRLMEVMSPSLSYSHDNRVLSPLLAIVILNWNIFLSIKRV